MRHEGDPQLDVVPVNKFVICVGEGRRGEPTRAKRPKETKRDKKRNRQTIVGRRRRRKDEP